MKVDLYSDSDTAPGDGTLIDSVTSDPLEQGATSYTAKFELTDAGNYYASVGDETSDAVKTVEKAEASDITVGVEKDTVGFIAGYAQPPALTFSIGETAVNVPADQYEIAGADYTGSGNDSTFDGTFTKAGTYTITKVNFSGEAANNLSNITDGDAEYKIVEAGAMTPAEAFSAGTLSLAYDKDNKVLQANEDGSFTVATRTVSGAAAANYVVPQRVTLADGYTTVNVTDSEKFDVKYYKADKDGKKTGNSLTGDIDIKAPSQYGYVLEIKGTSSAGDYENAVLDVRFNLASDGLDGIVAFDGTDQSDTTFVWDGGAQDVNFALNGKVLTVGTDIDVKYYKDGKGTGAADITDAGSYVAVVTAHSGSNYSGTARLNITVEKLNLSTASVSVNDVELDGTDPAEPAVIMANGVDVTSYVDWSSASEPILEAGAYEVTVEPKDAEEAPVAANIEGTATVGMNVVGTVVDPSLFMYGDSPLSSINGHVFNNAVEGFDANEISVKGYKANQYSVSVTDEDGNAADASRPGTYVVTVSMVPGTDFAVGGKAQAKFTVTDGSFGDADVMVTYKGKLYTNTAVAYTGEDVLADFAVTATLDGEELAEGTDYEVTVKGPDGKEVSEIVDAGTYTMTVKGLNYAGEFVVSIVVNPAKITGLKFQMNATMGSVLVGQAPYTGSAVVPTLVYTTVDPVSEAKSADWSVLPADMYSATYEECKIDPTGTVSGAAPIDASEVVELGDYRMTVALSEAASNYQLATASTSANMNVLPFQVVSAVEFADVDAAAWYATSVYTAASDGFKYMSGIPGTKLFMPEAQITRAEVAQVLVNMAGTQQNGGAGTYPTKFADVDAEAWFAFPVYWASQSGIVTGYVGTDLFGPNDAVTREQAATMLWRYMAAQGADVSASGDLSEYADGASVSDWAAEAMQWAVANDVFGVNTDELRPQGDLTRAEMAAIAVRVQPDGAVKLPTE